MKPSLNLLIIVFTFSLFSCNDQNLNENNEIIWNKMSSFRFYDRSSLPNMEISALNKSDFELMNYSEADLVEAKNILRQSIPKDTSQYLWKGASLVLVKFENNNFRKVMVSNYGSFFYDIKEKKFYTFEGSSRDIWKEFCSKHRKILYNKRRKGT